MFDFSISQESIQKNVTIHRDGGKLPKANLFAKACLNGVIKYTCVVEDDKACYELEFLGTNVPNKRIDYTDVRYLSNTFYINTEIGEWGFYDKLHTTINLVLDKMNESYCLKTTHFVVEDVVNVLSLCNIKTIPATYDEEVYESIGFAKEYIESNILNTNLDIKDVENKYRIRIFNPHEKVCDELLNSGEMNIQRRNFIEPVTGLQFKLVMTNHVNFDRKVQEYKCELSVAASIIVLPYTENYNV